MKKQNFLKGSVILMLSAVIAKGLGAVFKIPLTNLLGGVGMSYFSCAYSIFMPVYALVVTGISSAVAALTAKSAAFGMYDNARRVRSTAMIIFSAAGIPASLLMFVLAKPLSILSVGSPDAAPAAAMIAPAIIFGCITAVERGYYEGLSNMYPTAVSQVIEGIVKVFAGLWLCGFVMEHETVILRYIPQISDIRAAAAAAGILGVTLSSLGAVIYLLLVRLFTRGGAKGGEAAMLSRRTIARELIGNALPVGASAVVTNLTALIDMWTVIGCIKRFGTTAAMPSGIAPDELPRFVYGSFSGIALTVFNLVPSVTNMLGKGALTCTAEANQHCDKEELKRSTMQALFISAALALPAAAGMSVLAPEILYFLFPRQSDEVTICADALRLLMPGMLCLCVTFPLFSMLQAVGKPSLPLKIMLLGTAVKLLGNISLIPFCGINGAAVSTSVCYMLILCISLCAYEKASGIKIDKAPFLRLLYSGTTCAAAAYVTSSSLGRAGLGNFPVLSLSVIAGGIFYTVPLIMMFGKDLVHKKAPRDG